MRIEEFVGLAEKVTGRECKNVSVAIKEASSWLSARGLLPEIHNVPNFASALAAAAAPKALPSALTIAVPSANVGRLSAQGSAAVATLTGSVAAPAPTPKISTEALQRLARAVLGGLPTAPAGEQRELALRCLWQAHLTDALPESLRGEMADFSTRYWRPDPPVGYERSIAAARKDSIKKLASKLNLH